LIENLNDDRFKVRESATAELLQIGARAAPAVDQALATNPNLEMLRRLQGIRKSVTGPVLRGEKLQAFRAIEALEKIATPDAVDLLRSLADGAPGGLLTTHSRKALTRLKV
jgi:HEAT repeat protein